MVIELDSTCKCACEMGRGVNGAREYDSCLLKEREVMNRLPYIVSVLLAIISNLHHTAPHLYIYAVKTLERTFFLCESLQSLILWVSHLQGCILHQPFFSTISSFVWLKIFIFCTFLQLSLPNVLPDLPLYLQCTSTFDGSQEIAAHTM